MQDTHQEPYDLAWLLINATRQAFSLGYRIHYPYGAAAAAATLLAPQITERAEALLEALEGSLVKLYRERATAMARSPAHLVDRDIKQYEAEAKHLRPEQRKAIDSQITRLHRVKAILEEEHFTESQALIHDTDSVLDYPVLPVSGRGKDYREFSLGANRSLRVRLLHPDPPEGITGIDLIYETYCRASRSKELQVRIAALQYKMWDGKAIYTSGKKREGILSQINRAEEFFCKGGLCKQPRAAHDGGVSYGYRFPHCAAFFRPTDRTQSPGTPRSTKGWHIPICHLKDSYRNSPDGNVIIEADAIASSSLNAYVFNPLYNNNMLGSRWLKASSLEKIYKKAGILIGSKRPLLHAQEYSFNPEAPSVPFELD